MGVPQPTAYFRYLLCLSTLLTSVVISRADAPAPATTRAASTAATAPSSTSAPATTTVKRGSLPMKFDASGYLEPIDPFEVRIRPKAYNGELTIAVIVANGATVKKGETLLEIDPAPMKRQLEAAQSEADVAKANVTKAEADAKIAKDAEALAMRMAKEALEDAQDNVKWWEGVDGPQMIASAELGLKQYRENVEDRADELDQLKKMYKSEELTNATADIVVKRAIRGLEQGKKLLEMEEMKTEKSETFYYPISKRRVYDTLTQAKHSLASLQAAQAQSKVARQAGLVAVHAALVVAEQKLSDMRADSEKLTITAPADGIVWYGSLASGNWQAGDPKALKVGEKIAAQQTVMTLYAPGKLRVVADLTEAKYYSVSPDTKATIRPSAFPAIHIEGTCAATPRTPVMTQTGPIYPLTIQAGGDVDSRLMPGMRCSIQMNVPPLEGVLLVPSGAVVDSNVWVVDSDGSEHKRAVVTGHSDGKSIEIVSGVKEGEKVLSQGKQS
jgi:multidrug efflux pump subunit AcrA (membrane-fusion protein)